MLGRLAAVVATFVAAAGVVLAPLDAAPRLDYAAAAWTILPPGENGSLSFDRNTRDQALLYDSLTPLSGTVTVQDVRRFFKRAPLGATVVGGKRERPRTGVTIARDPYGVAHVTGRTEADVAFGAGWVTAADRGLLLQLLRRPARLAALDVSGLDPLAVALSGKTFVPSAEAEAFLANQLDAVRSQGVVGRKVLARSSTRTSRESTPTTAPRGSPSRRSRRTTWSLRQRSSRRGSARTAGKRRETRCSWTRSPTGSVRPRHGACSRTFARRTTPRRRRAFPDRSPRRRRRRRRREASCSTTAASRARPFPSRGSPRTPS